MRKKIVIETAYMLFFALGIGLLLAIAANLFVEGVNFASEYRRSSTWANFEFGGAVYSYSSIVFLLLAAGFLKFIKFLFRIEAWAGPADSIYAAHTPDPPLNFKKGVGSTLSSFVVASSGGSVGQYGPLVHFGSTVGLLFKQISKNKLKNDVLIGCGVAAAISAGFNAPLAGVIFAHESILRHFSFRAIAPIFIASISASTFSEYAFENNESIFSLTQSVPSLGEIVPVLVVLGPIFAVVAMTFMLSLRFAQSVASKSITIRAYLPFVAAIICGAVGTFLPEILGIGIGPINQIIANEFSAHYVFILLIAKICMTALCIGFGLFGGIFSPALFIGVATGSVVATLLATLGQTGFEQVVIISAMAAVSASVIGAPISIILIVLELTGSYDYAIAAMIAVIISTLITHRMFGPSFFDRQLLDRGINMALGRETIALRLATVSSCEGCEFTQIRYNTTGNDAYQEMKTEGVVEAYVFRESSFVGKLSLADAVTAGDKPITEFIDQDPFSLYDLDSLDFAMRKITSFIGETIPVLSKKDSSLLTVVSEGNIFQSIIDIQQKVRRIERE